MGMGNGERENALATAWSSSTLRHARRSPRSSLVDGWRQFEPIEAPEPVRRPTAVAAELVDGDRQDAYGHPLINHERIAAFWTVRLLEKLRPGEVVEPHEAAAMMRLAKEARLMQTIGHPDSLVDQAGYADVEHEIHEGYGSFGRG
jgi:hypothetical protein